MYLFLFPWMFTLLSSQMNVSLSFTFPRGFQSWAFRSQYICLRFSDILGWEVLRSGQSQFSDIFTLVLFLRLDGSQLPW